MQYSLLYTATNLCYKISPGYINKKNPLSPPRQEILKIINAVNEITNITACTSEISKGYLIGFILK
jgi:hypothetical protein